MIFSPHPSMPMQLPLLDPILPSLFLEQFLGFKSYYHQQTPNPLWGPRSLISSRFGSYPCPAGAAASLLEGGGVSLLFRPRLLYPAGMSGAGVEVG